MVFIFNIMSPYTLPNFYLTATAPTETYTLSLHDALPISAPARGRCPRRAAPRFRDLRPRRSSARARRTRSEEHTSELQSQSNLVCRLLLEKKKVNRKLIRHIQSKTLFMLRHPSRSQMLRT